MSHDVFICHSSNDRTVANAICAKLEQARIRCWMAPRDVLPGSDYAASIIEAVGSSRLTILVFSKDANESPHVRREIERTVSRGIPILPLRVEDVLPSPSLEYFISDAHWLDAMTPPLERHLDQLVSVVRTLLGSGVAPGGRPEAVGGPPATPPAPGPEVVPTPPPEAPTGAGGRWAKLMRRRRVLAAGAAGIVALVAIGIVGSMALSGVAPATPSPTSAQATSTPAAPTASPDSGLTARSELTAGDCLLTPGMQLVTGQAARDWQLDYWNRWAGGEMGFALVLCDDPHGAEVFATDDQWNAAASYPGDRALGVRAESICSVERVRLAASKPDSDRIGWQSFWSTEEDWDAGERFLHCVAWSLNGYDLGGSLLEDGGELVPRAKIVEGDCILTPDRYAGSPADQLAFWEGHGPSGGWPSFQLVFCDQPHGAEAFYRGEPWDPDRGWEGDDAYWPAWEEICRAPGDRRAAEPPTSTRPWWMSQQEWDDGERYLTCLLFSMDGTNLEASLLPPSS